MMVLEHFMVSIQWQYEIDGDQACALMNQLVERMFSIGTPVSYTHLTLPTKA